MTKIETSTVQSNIDRGLVTSSDAYVSSSVTNETPIEYSKSIKDTIEKELDDHNIKSNHNNLITGPELRYALTHITDDIIDYMVKDTSTPVSKAINSLNKNTAKKADAISSKGSATNGIEVDLGGTVSEPVATVKVTPSTVTYTPETSESPANLTATPENSVLDGTAISAIKSYVDQNKGTTYSAGDGIEISSDNAISIDDTVALKEDIIIVAGDGDGSGVQVGGGNEATGELSIALGSSNKATNNASYAEGYKTTSSAAQSHSEGYSTTASANYSHAENDRTKASGQASHAEGTSTIASELSAHAEGSGTTASGQASHAEGGKSTASGKRAHAEGYNTVSSGNSSHAEGYETNATGPNSHTEGQDTTATAGQAHAEGHETTASGVASHAEGYQSKASEQYSHAEGRETTAGHPCSHAEGVSSAAYGAGAHAEGYGTKTLNNGEHAEGQYNLPVDGKTLSTIGIGTSNSNRKNAIEVWNNGNIYIYGLGNYDGTNSKGDDTKTLVDVINAFSGKLTYKVVDELPEASADTEGAIYLVPSSTTTEKNVRDEYLTIKTGDDASATYSWELIGSTAIDLEDYLNKKNDSYIKDSSYNDNLLVITKGDDNTIEVSIPSNVTIEDASETNDGYASAYDVKTVILNNEEVIAAALYDLHDTKQDVLTAGDNITIKDNVISATVTAPDLVLLKDATEENDGCASAYDVKTVIEENEETISAAINDLYDTKQIILEAGDNITINGNTISATDTTYESLAPAAEGEDVSLVTTGEKYTWNSKQDELIAGDNIAIENNVISAIIPDAVSLKDASETNDGYASAYDVRTVIEENEETISAAINDLYDTKQDTLVSGTNIKTINGESLLGSGDIEIKLDSANVTYTPGSDDEDPSLVIDEETIDNFADGNAIQAVKDYFTEIIDDDEYALSLAINNLNTDKQDILVSGETIKTINGESLLGSGDIEIKLDSANVTYTPGTSDEEPSLVIDEETKDNFADGNAIQSVKDYFTEVINKDEFINASAFVNVESEIVDLAETINTIDEVASKAIMDLRKTKANVEDIPETYIESATSNDVVLTLTKSDSSTVEFDTTNCIRSEYNYSDTNVNVLVGSNNEFQYNGKEIATIEDIPDVKIVSLSEASETNDGYASAYDVRTVIEENEETISAAINDLYDIKQDVLTAGDNITIENNVISASVPNNVLLSEATSENDGYASAYDVQTVIKSNEEVSSAALNYLEDNKQDVLVSGTNIKTINGESLLGSGDIEIQSLSASQVTCNISSDRFDMSNVDEGLNQLVTAVEYDAEYTAKYKQDTLVSGSNIKTINGESLLGSGDISISTGSGTLIGTDGITINTTTTSESTTSTISANKTSITYTEETDSNDASIVVSNPDTNHLVDGVDITALINYFEAKISALQTKITELTSNVYTKTEVDNTFAKSTDVYSIDEIDSIFSSITNNTESSD